MFISASRPLSDRLVLPLWKANALIIRMTPKLFRSRTKRRNAMQTQYKDEDREMVAIFEAAFGAPYDALMILANQHAVLPIGVIEYWKEKMSAIQQNIDFLENISRENSNK